MFRVTLSEAVASGTTIYGDRGSCGTKQWQDLTHRGDVCWSAKDRSASVQKLKQFSMPVHSVMLVQNTAKQYGAKHFKSIHSRLRFHLVKRFRYRSTANHLIDFFLLLQIFFTFLFLFLRECQSHQNEGSCDMKESEAQGNRGTERLQTWKDREALWIRMYKWTGAELSGWFYHSCLKHHLTYGTQKHKHKEYRKKRN